MKLTDLFESADVLEQCRPYLNATDGKFLIRGMKPGHQKQVQGIPYSEHAVRLNRRARDMDDEVHELIDDAFEKAFGVRARSTSMFCLSDRALTRDRIDIYGERHLVLPIGNFTYLWSPHVIDLADEMEELVEEFEFENLDLNEWIKDVGYTTTGLKAALELNNEIMIQCKNYLAFPYSEQALEFLREAH